MAARRCEKCGGWTTPPTPCKPCRQANNRRRQQTRPPRTEYAGAWRYNSQQLRQQWIQLHGYWCPGWNIPPWPGRPAHPATDLVVDHDLGILCRTCNSSKAATHDRHRAKLRREQTTTPDNAGTPPPPPPPPSLPPTEQQ